MPQMDIHCSELQVKRKNTLPRDRLLIVSLCAYVCSVNMKYILAKDAQPNYELVKEAYVFDKRISRTRYEYFDGTTFQSGGCGAVVCPCTEIWLL